MNRNGIIVCGILTAFIPVAVVLWSHTVWWPEIFAARTDTFFPNGPTHEFSDFVPSQRTDEITVVDGTRVRPLAASPVYLLFQPRVHAKLIRVVLVARPNFGAAFSASSTTGTVRIGYRTGDTPETNVTAPAVAHARAGGWFEWASVPMLFSAMARERVDARRVVFEFPFSSGGSQRWYVRSVRIFYEE